MSSLQGSSEDQGFSVSGAFLLLVLLQSQRSAYGGGIAVDGVPGVGGVSGVDDGGGKDRGITGGTVGGMGIEEEVVVVEVVVRQRWRWWSWWW